MSLIRLIEKIYTSIETCYQEDLTIQEAHILAYDSNGKLYVLEAEDLDVSLSNIKNIMLKNEDLIVDGKILKVIFYGSEENTDEKYVYFLKRLNDEKDSQSQDQNSQSSSSQEEIIIPRKRAKKENIREKLNTIKDLIRQIEKDLCETKEIGQNVMKEKFTIQKINFEQTLTSKDKEISLKQDLIKQFQVKLAQQRNSFDWIKMVNRFQLPNVDEEK